MRGFSCSSRRRDLDAVAVAREVGGAVIGAGRMGPFEDGLRGAISAARRAPGRSRAARSARGLNQDLPPDRFIRSVSSTWIAKSAPDPATPSIEIGAPGLVTTTAPRPWPGFCAPATTKSPWSARSLAVAMSIVSQLSFRLRARRARRGRPPRGRADPRFQGAEQASRLVLERLSS